MSYVINRGFGAATGGQYLQAAGGTLLSAAALAGPAAPFVALAGAITEMLASFGVGSGCGQTCVLSSQFANQAEAKLKQNLLMYLAIPAPRPASARAAALANFDQIWAWLTQQCSNPQLGDAGVRCISDRQAGACKWHDNSGGCWNWFVGYRDAIANDTNVFDDSVSAQAAGAGSSLLDVVTGGAPSTSGWLPLAAMAGLLAVAVLS